MNIRQTGSTDRRKYALETFEERGSSCSWSSSHSCSWRAITQGVCCCCQEKRFFRSFGLKRIWFRAFRRKHKFTFLDRCSQDPQNIKEYILDCGHAQISCWTLLRFAKELYDMSLKTSTSLPTSGLSQNGDSDYGRLWKSDASRA